MKLHGTRLQKSSVAAATKCWPADIVGADAAPRYFDYLPVGLFALVMGSAGLATAQSARDIRGPAPVLPLAPGSEAQPRLIVDAPDASALARGLVVIQYRAANLHIVPVFGPGALDVSPRVGHIHVTVDTAPWHWADASGEPLIIQGLPAGHHTVRIDLVDANHKPFDHAVVRFVIPEKISPGNPQ